MKWPGSDRDSSAVEAVTSKAGRRSRSAGRWVLSFPARIAGGPRKLPIRAAMFVAVLAGMTSMIGFVIFLASNADVSAESGPLLRGLFEILLNTYIWALFVVVGAAVLWSKLDSILAAETARHTRFSRGTVERLAAEAKTTDRTVRLIGTTDHTKDQLKAKLLRVYRGERTPEDETPGEETAVQTSARTDEATALGEPDRGGALEGRVEASSANETPGGTSTRVDESADLPVLPDPPALVEDAGGENANSDTETPVDGPVDQTENQEEEPSSTASAATSLRQQFRLMRMDLGTAFNTAEFLWRWLLPAVATFAGVIVLARRVWFRWYVYIAIAAFAVFVATTYYGVFKARRRRKLRKLRRERQPATWNGCNCLAKRVDTNEATGYYAIVGGRRYFDFDAVRLANTVADRWHRRINGESVPPAIQQKYHRNVRQMLPTVYHTEHDEGDGRPAIMDDLIREVADATDPHGIVPKYELAERVIDRGRDGGHDPDLIAECYADLVPEVLSEREVLIEDTDGNERTITVVHLRTETITPQLAQLRSQFSSRVSGDETAAHPLPDVDAARIDRQNPPAHMREVSA